MNYSFNNIIHKGLECVAHSELQVFQFQVEFSYYKNSVLNFQRSSDIIPALPSKKNISICARQGFIPDIMRNYNISLSVSGMILYFILEKREGKKNEKSPQFFKYVQALENRLF